MAYRDHLRRFAFGLYKTHAGATCSFGNGIRIDKIIFIAFDIRLYVLRRGKFDVVSVALTRALHNRLQRQLNRVVSCAINLSSCVREICLRRSMR